MDNHRILMGAWVFLLTHFVVIVEMQNLLYNGDFETYILSQVYQGTNWTVDFNYFSTDACWYRTDAPRFKFSL